MSPKAVVTDNAKVLWKSLAITLLIVLVYLALEAHGCFPSGAHGFDSPYQL
jgi:hypothetical protein